MVRIGFVGSGLWAAWGLTLFLEGCAGASGGYGESLDRGQDAIKAAREEAQLNFDCSSMKADRRVGKIHEGDAQGGLFSEYLVDVRGCGQRTTYRVSCREGGLCSVEE